LAFYLAETDWLQRFIVLLSCTQLFSITFIGQAHLLNFIVMTGFPIGWLLWEWKTGKLSLKADESGAPV
jgi:hypothetical protein